MPFLSPLSPLAPANGPDRTSTPTRRRHEPAADRRRSRAPRRGVRGTLAALALAVVGLLMLGAPPASAALTIFDSFEPLPAPQNWSFSHTGLGTGGFSNLEVRTGTRDAFISMRDNGFSSVSRHVFLSHPQNCSASIWVNPGPIGSPFQLVNFEIIEPSTFTYIALKSATLSSSAPYTKFSTSWVNSPTHFLVRVSIIGNGPGTTVAAWVDDLSLVCS
jgi:hypothetical protein